MSVKKEEKNLFWYVLYTKPRCEKKVAQRLKEAGYSIYCPLQKIIRQWTDRTKMVVAPLFQFFLFIQIEDHRRYEIFAYPGTVGYLFWMRHPARVRPGEINSIQKRLGDYNHKDIDIYHIQPRDYAHKFYGQFSDKEAVLLERTNQRAVVRLEELRIQLSLQLSNNDLSAFEKSPNRDKAYKWIKKLLKLVCGLFFCIKFEFPRRQ